MLDEYARTVATTECASGRIPKRRGHWRVDRPVVTTGRSARPVLVPYGMTRRLAIFSAAALLVLVACGDDDGDGGTSSQPGESIEPASAAVDTATTDPATTDPATTEPIGAGFPAECVLPPVTVTAQRVGTAPIGSDAFGVIDAVVVPIPIVPNPDDALTPEEMKVLATTTDLLGYTLVFADEEITGGGSMFFDHEPSTAGKLSGQVGIFPSAGVPFAAGDVVVYGEVPGLSVPALTMGMDLSEFEQDLINTYLNDPSGQVEVLGITDEALCLDVDLTWDLNGPRDNVLTVRGVFTGRLIDRSTLFVLG